jgi:hypothetical protein
MQSHPAWNKLKIEAVYCMRGRNAGRDNQTRPGWQTDVP